MTAKKSDPIEQAMADALESVERIERKRKGDEPESEAVVVEIDDDLGTVELADEVDAGDEGDEGDEGDDAPGADDGEKVAALKDQVLRLAADFDNYRKRSRKEREDARQYGTEAVLKDLLPVIDNLERALAHSDDDDSPVVQGVQMIIKQFLDAMAGHGVVGFVSVGQGFDPERHEAMSQAPAGDCAPGSVLEELEKGYMLRDRLLRPAKVIVAAAAPEDSEPEEEG